MAAVELFFSGLGWCLFALGLGSCLIPRCFKLAVIIMLVGDLALMLGILFPRMFATIAIFHHAGWTAVMYRVGGIVLAIACYLLVMYLRYRRSKRQVKTASKRIADQDHVGHAPADLFSKVKNTAALRNPDQEGQHDLPAGALHGDK